MGKFVNCDRYQAFLLPPDLWDWMPEDDLAHFVIEAVDRLDLVAFKVNHRWRGAVPSADDAGVVDLLQCHRDFFEPPERAGDAPGYRGSLCVGERASGP
jgi:hypothetical protein